MGARGMAAARAGLRPIPSCTPLGHVRCHWQGADEAGDGPGVSMSEFLCIKVERVLNRFRKLL